MHRAMLRLCVLLGIIDILCRTDDKGGPIVNFLLTLKPGMTDRGGPDQSQILQLPPWAKEMMLETIKIN